MTTEIIDRETAAKRQMVHYYTGKPCKRKHLAPRFVANGGCIDCINPKAPPSTPLGQHVQLPPFFIPRTLGVTLTPELIKEIHAKLSAHLQSAVREAIRHPTGTPDWDN